jgi:hypothetical protein
MSDIGFSPFSGFFEVGDLAQRLGATIKPPKTVKALRACGAYVIDARQCEAK